MRPHIVTCCGSDTVNQSCGKNLHLCMYTTVCMPFKEAYKSEKACSLHYYWIRVNIAENQGCGAVEAKTFLISKMWSKLRWKCIKCVMSWVLTLCARNCLYIGWVTWKRCRRCGCNCAGRMVHLQLAEVLVYTADLRHEHYQSSERIKYKWKWFEAQQHKCTHYFPLK